MKKGLIIIILVEYFFKLSIEQKLTVILSVVKKQKRNSDFFTLLKRSDIRSDTIYRVATLIKK